MTKGAVEHAVPTRNYGSPMDILDVTLRSG